MGNTNNFHKARRAVIRLTVWQVLLTALLAISGAVLVNSMFAVSVAVGGTIGLLAGFYQAQRMLQFDAGKDPAGFMRAMWVSEIGKIFLTFALFVLAIRLLQVQMVPTIVGYAGTYIVYWVALGTRYPWFEVSTTNNLRDKNWPTH